MVSTFQRILIWGISLMVLGAVLTACGGSASSANVVNVTVTLSDFKYDSSLTTFKQGVAYHFTVTNNGATNHDFYIMPPSTDPLTADQAKAMSLAGISGDQLPPGTSKTLDYTFTKAYPAGSLEFACHLPGHYDAGMHLPVIVQ
jgi:uncharacterized cupredoxin-like copper-binding protein